MNDTLKKFTIVFGVNTQPLDKGIQKSETTIKKFGKVFNSVVATYFSYKVFQGAIQGFNDLNTKISNASDLMGYSSENLSALGGALKRFGGDTDSAISSLNSLSKGLQEARFGGGALVEVAKRYGITFTQSNGKLMSAEGLLMSLSKQMGRYDRQTRVAIASQLGLDDSLTRAFTDGGEELRKLIAEQKRFGVVSQKDIKLTTQFTKATLNLRDSFNGVVRMFSRLVLPALTKLLKLITRFVEFLKKHKQLVVIFFTALLVAMLPVLALLGKMAIASAVAFAPIFAVVAVVSAIALIIEDIYGYFMGWDSVTGDLAKKFPILGKALEAIRPIVMGIADVFKSIYEWITDPTWEKFANIFKVAGENIKTFILGALESVSAVFSGLIEKMTGFFGGLGGQVMDFLGFSNAPAISGGGNSQTNTNNITNNVTQNISSATPQQLANDFNALAIGSVNQQRQQQGVR